MADHPRLPRCRIRSWRSETAAPEAPVALWREGERLFGAAGDSATLRARLTRQLRAERVMGERRQGSYDVARHAALARAAAAALKAGANKKAPRE